ncbi:hypothetical protein B0J12DRAFT_610761 [Macrophomina phaseolina]|uniref:Uncharacterized protein n=1 Tax=Macrophomina phaseolina TaxID=35725 RepID=A0ABQ8FV09_9PEZI|nr:hypothetical protein B0J12DRAFT_610761 [Macrophomina phaseolina]
MTDSVASISRGGFIYDGSFRADVGNRNSHPRASLSQLASLLRPKRTKSINRKQARDQVGHWYFAQLKHYGLPTTKDKNAAKVRLLNALNTKALKVPKDVKGLEAEMKKEFKAANGGSKPGPLDQKRASGRKGTNNPEVTSSAAASSVKKTKMGRHEAARDEMRSNPRGVPRTLDNESSSKTMDGLRDTTKVMTTTPIRNSSQRAQSSRAPPPLTRRSSLPAKQSSSIDMTNITGIYEVNCPCVEEEWDCGPGCRMLLYYTDSASCLWGEFDLGPWWGIIYMEPGPSKFSNAKINFNWRANQHETHSPSFGPDCTGFLVFSHLGEIRGTLWGLYGDAVEFIGRRRPGPKTCGLAKTTYYFESRWREIEESAKDPYAKGWTR